nr:5626_t:CDS:2 [Entrophospora candida]
MDFDYLISKYLEETDYTSWSLINIMHYVADLINLTDECFEEFIDSLRSALYKKIQQKNNLKSAKNKAQKIFKNLNPSVRNQKEIKNFLLGEELKFGQILYDTNVGLSVMEDKTIKVQISNSEYRDFITQKLESDKNNGLNDYTPYPTMNDYDLEGNVAESEKDFCNTKSIIENVDEALLSDEVPLPSKNTDDKTSEGIIDPNTIELFHKYQKQIPNAHKVLTFGKLDKCLFPVDEEDLKMLEDLKSLESEKIIKKIMQDNTKNKRRCIETENSPHLNKNQTPTK